MTEKINSASLNLDGSFEDDPTAWDQHLWSHSYSWNSVCGTPCKPLWFARQISQLPCSLIDKLISNGLQKSPGEGRRRNQLHSLLQLSKSKLSIIKQAGNLKNKPGNCFFQHPWMDCGQSPMRWGGNQMSWRGSFVTITMLPGKIFSRFHIIHLSNFSKLCSRKRGMIADFFLALVGRRRKISPWRSSSSITHMVSPSSSFLKFSTSLP